MATATYNDYVARHPESKAEQGTVEAFLDDVAAEIAARCESRGTTYEALVAKRGALVRRVECAAVYRLCGRNAFDGVEQNALKSFSQTVGDHKWEIGYASGGGNTLMLDAEWKSLGLSGQQVGWLGIPWAGDGDD
jgi:hypothetical protein